VLVNSHRGILIILVGWKQNLLGEEQNSKRNEGIDFFVLKFHELMINFSFKVFEIANGSLNVINDNQFNLVAKSRY